jgi:hypothetical protein
MSQNIFITENQDLNTVRENLENRLNVNDFSVVSKEIFEKVYNNKVGYFIFKSGEEFFKIFILPKHLNVPKDMSSEQKVIQEFIEYFKIHYRLQSKYKKYSNNISIKSVIELVFENDHPIYKAQDIEQFVFYKCEHFLLHIKQFFERHKSTRKKLTPYSSQTIKYQFDLAKNIVELDKTKIHQKKYKNFIYSEIANITYAAIKLFVNNKVELMEEHNTNKEYLMKLSKEIQLLLRKKFNAKSSNRLTLPQLTSTKTHKYFKKKQNFLTLYGNILALFGIENILDESVYKDINRNLFSETYFLDPALLYEWYIYDVLKHSNLVNNDGYYIALDKNEGTCKEYRLQGDFNKTSITSYPDLIITKSKDIYIIDVKWKKVDNKSIELNDMLKLKRDAEARISDGNVYAILIYFSIEQNRKIQEFLHGDKNPSFSFYATKISFSNNSFSLEKFNELAIQPLSFDTLVKGNHSASLKVLQ